MNACAGCSVMTWKRSSFGAFKTSTTAIDHFSDGPAVVGRLTLCKIDSGEWHDTSPSLVTMGMPGVTNTSQFSGLSRVLNSVITPLSPLLACLRAGLAGGAARERRSVGAKLEQDLAAAIRSHRSLDRFFELLERVDMLHRGPERSTSYEVAQLLVNLLDLCAGRVAYPIDEPESVEAEITIDEVFGRDRRELPAQNGVDDSRAASLERLGQFAHRSSAYGIEDEAQFPPVESRLNILV